MSTKKTGSPKRKSHFVRQRQVRSTPGHTMMMDHVTTAEQVIPESNENRRKEYGTTVGDRSKPEWKLMQKSFLTNN